MEYTLSEEIWQIFYKILTYQTEIRIKNKDKTKLFLNATFYCLKTGCQWRALDKKYGNWNTIYKRFREWSLKGVFDYLYAEILALKNENETFRNNLIEMIDSTIIKAHPCAAGYKKDGNEGLGRSVGGFSSKISAVVKNESTLLRAELISGAEHDINSARRLLKNTKNKTILADKAYFCQKLRTHLIQNHCKVVIPSKKNSLHPINIDLDLYKQRNKVERFFNKIKHFRRVFTRYDKTSLSFMSFTLFAASIIVTR